MNSNEDCGYIYIMTNPGMNDLIKIGYAADPEKRRKELSSSSGVPADFEIYATYAVPVKLADKKVHNLIVTLNPNLKFNPKKEFFAMTPDDAFKILEALASIHGRMHKLYKYVDGTAIPMDLIPADNPDEGEKDGKDGKLGYSDHPELTFDSKILLKGGNPARFYLKELFNNSDYIDSSWFFTLAKLNKDKKRDKKRFWANPDKKCINDNWCLVLNDNIQRKLYVFKIPKDTFDIDNLKTRIHNGKTQLDIEIINQDDIFVCISSRINYTKWLVDVFSY